RQEYVDLNQTKMEKSMKMAMMKLPTGADRVSPARVNTTAPRPSTSPRFNPPPMVNATGAPETPREKPFGNRSRTIGAYMGNNATSPGSGVGPRVKLPPPHKSELGGKL